MKPKTLTIILGMILIVGILVAGVGADEEYVGVISNTTGIDISNFVAGSTTTANFSFDYEDIYEADKHYPLIFKINISYAGTECQLDDCSVWKGDFAIDGVLRRYYMFGLYHKDIKLECSEECSEESPLIINHQMGSNEVNVPNGTFYCYNITEGTIETLKKRNKVFLNIFSNPALYPATYKITAEMFYANDTKAPIVDIINKADFEGKYYRELMEIEVQTTISDNIEISDTWGTIFTSVQNFTDFSKYETGGTYYFTKTLPINIPEGEWELKIFAKDTEGNIGSDNTTLKIDRTGPNITAIQPNGSIYTEIIPVELNVTDEGAGVNTEEVYYRLREMNGTSICPEAGIGTWDCYNSGWVKLELNESSGLYETEINTTEIGLESGEYWFEAKAEDILGNIGILE